MVKRGRTRWYRIVSEAQDVTVDRLSIAGVQRILDKAGIDMADLVPADPPARHG